MGLNIGVNVNADVSKLQALDRQMKQLKATYDALAKSAKSAGSSFGASMPSMGGQMPLAGAVVPPSGFALMSSGNPHAGLAGSKLPPVMWGASYRAQLHNMMPGQIAHQNGAQSALTQLANQQRSTAGSSTYGNTGMTGLTGQLKLLTTSIDNLTKVLQHPVAAPSSTSNAALNMNPYVSLQSESVALQAMNPIASVSYPARVQAKMTVAQNRVANPTQPAKSSIMQKVGQVAYRMAGGSYLGEMAGGAAADALGIGGSLAGIGMTAGVGALIGAGMWSAHKIGQGYQTYQQTSIPLSALYHSVAPGTSYSSFYNSIIGQGNSVGGANVMKAQVAQILASTGGTSALNSVGSVFQGAVGLGYGVNGATTLANQLAQLQQMGLTSGLSASTSNAGLMMMLGNSSVLSGMGGRTQQLIDAMTTLTQSLDQGRTTPPNATALLSMMTTLSKPINGQYLQSAQGQRGANILADINNSLTNPGNGTAGSMLMYEFLTAGTNMTPGQEIYLAHEGLTGRFNGKGPTNLQRITQGTLSRFPVLASGLTPTGTPSAAQQLALDQMYGTFNLKSPQQLQLFLGQFAKNGKFSMTNLQSEQNWWSNLGKMNGGKSLNASWDVVGAQLYNANSYASMAGVANAMQTGGVTLSSKEQQQLKQLKTLNPHSKQYASMLGTLKQEMGKQMLNSTMLTGQDANTAAINQNTNAWTKIATYLQPISTDLNKLAGWIPGGGAPVKSGKAPQLKGDAYGRAVPWTTSYDVTGHQSLSSMVGNMAFTGLVSAALSGNGSSSVQNMSYSPSGGSSAINTLRKFFGLGSLSGASAVSPTSVSGAGISQWSKYIKQAAAKYGIPANMIAAVMKTESGGQNGLTSSAGAQGLMQIMPSNDKALGITNPWSAQQNIMGGAKMLSRLYGQFGNWTQALEGYNGGPGSVYSTNPKTRQAVDSYAGTVESFYAAFQKHPPIQVHVHVHSSTGNLNGTEQWTQSNPNPNSA